MKNKRIWILGAPDPEMQEIENLLKEAEETFWYAARDERRVHPGTAYRANGFLPDSPKAESSGTVILVECAVDKETRDRLNWNPEKVDHHRSGDPGYGCPPAEYWDASSIGQVYRILHGDAEPPNRLKLVAAADHCLRSAYQGECPGVDPEELMEWRIRSRAEFQGRDPEVLMADVNRSRTELFIRVAETDPDDCRRIDLGGEYVADCRDEHLPELPEASAREGIGFIATPTSPDGRKKVVCFGTEAQVRAFLEEWAPAHGLDGLYGDPTRGFAGGHESAPEKTEDLLDFEDSKPQKSGPGMGA